MELPFSVLYYGTRDLLKLHIFQDQSKERVSANYLQFLNHDMSVFEQNS